VSKENACPDLRHYRKSSLDRLKDCIKPWDTRRSGQGIDPRLADCKQVHLRDAKLEAERQCSTDCSGAYCRCDEGCGCNLRLTEH
jgi:hypothetical protein